MPAAGAGPGPQRPERHSQRAPPAGTSPYTRTLLPILKTPGLSLQQIATRVRAEVAELAKKAQPPHEQTPAYYDQLLGEFVLRAGAAGDVKPAVAAPPSEVERDWAAAKDTSSIAMLEAFIARYRGTFQASLAQARIAELKRTEESKKVAVAIPKPDPAPPPKVMEPAVAVTPGSELTQGRTFRDCPDRPEMVVVPAGSFMMGSPPGEKDR